MATLEATGELDNTYVMFTSDNGFFLGEHRRRQGKIIAYDPSLRVPLVMRGPGIPAGEERRDPFLMIDFVPTILEAAGVATDQPLDGAEHARRRPLRRHGAGPADPHRDRPARAQRRYTRADGEVSRWSRSKPGGTLVAAVLPGGAHRALPVRRARQRRASELYDMRRDPGQFVSVVERPRYAGLVQRALAAELERLRTRASGAECASPLPPALRTDDPVPAAGSTRPEPPESHRPLTGSLDAARPMGHCHRFRHTAHA